jgi:HK97 family phage major capsid protein
MGGELDAQAMEGVGSPFTGVMFATSVNDAGATNSVTGVKVTYMPATAATGTWASLVRIYTKSGQGNQRNDGIFVCGPGVYTQIIGLVDTNGQPVVRLGTVEGQPNNTLFGRPIVVSSMLGPYTIGAGTASVGSLYFGPPSALLFGLRKGITWDVSEQVNWAKYQADARMVGRFGYVVGVPAAWTKQINIIV